MNRRDGFTYAEFTVAMAIICILAAILFPVFARAQQKARQTKCLNHLLNIGAALGMYAADWHGHFPAADNDLTPLVPDYLPDAAALTCPTASSARSPGPPPWPPHHVLPLPGDYVYRGGLCDDDLPNIMIAADDVGDRHNDGANYLSVDGHTKWIRLYEDRHLQRLRTKYRGFDEIQALRGESVPPPPAEQPLGGPVPAIPEEMLVPPDGPAGPPPISGRPGP